MRVFTERFDLVWVHHSMNWGPRLNKKVNRKKGGDGRRKQAQHQHSPPCFCSVSRWLVLSLPYLDLAFAVMFSPPQWTVHTFNLLVETKPALYVGLDKRVLTAVRMQQTHAPPSLATSSCPN